MDAESREVQVNLGSMLRIKEVPRRCHKVFNFAQSLRAYVEATYVFKGNLDAEVTARVRAGVLLDVGGGGCATKELQVDLASALASSKCARVRTRSGALVRWHWPTCLI